MSTSIQSTQLSQDLIQVGESWTQKSREKFAIARLPKAKLRDARNQILETTYQLPKLENSLLDGKGLQDWEPGEAVRPSKKLGKDSVTVKVTGKQSEVIDRPMKREGRYVYADLENNVVSMCLSQLYQGIDIAAKAAMQNTAFFSTAVAFTNGGGALDASSDFANQKPDIDINNTLQGLRKWRSMGLSLEMHLDFHVAMVLGRHPVYTGAGTGSAIASQLPIEEIVSVLKRVHALDAVYIYENSYNEAREGQTADINHTMNGLLFVGAFDRRQDLFDIEADPVSNTPDGAIVIGLGREPETVTWDDVSAECTYFVGRTAFSVFCPRSGAAAGTMGRFFQASGAGGIFTTLP